MSYESRFDYDYKDIYDDDYWNYKDKQESSLSKNRKKRSLPNETIVQTNETKKITGLRRTNSASSVLGLNILLYQDHDDYKGKTWTGVVQNSFLGFKVFSIIINNLKLQAYFEIIVEMCYDIYFNALGFGA